MLYKEFRNEAELLGGHANFVQAYTAYLQSGDVPTTLLNDIHSLQLQIGTDDTAENTDTHSELITSQNHSNREG